MRSAFLALSFVLALAGQASADELIESYGAYIGQDDLYNSANERLTQPWQIIRQDRANVHRFGIRQPGDEVDRFFASQANRDLAERLIQAGQIDPHAAHKLRRGDVGVEVQIWRGPNGDYINIAVD